MESAWDGQTVRNIPVKALPACVKANLLNVFRVRRVSLDASFLSEVRVRRIGVVGRQHRGII